MLLRLRFLVFICDNHMIILLPCLQNGDRWCQSSLTGLCGSKEHVCLICYMFWVSSEAVNMYCAGMLSSLKISCSEKSAIIWRLWKHSEWWENPLWVIWSLEIRRVFDFKTFSFVPSFFLSCYLRDENKTCLCFFLKIVVYLYMYSVYMYVQCTYW